MLFCEGMCDLVTVSTDTVVASKKCFKKAHIYSGYKHLGYMHEYASRLSTTSWHRVVSYGMNWPEVCYYQPAYLLKYYDASLNGFLICTLLDCAMQVPLVSKTSFSISFTIQILCLQ